MVRTKKRRKRRPLKGDAPVQPIPPYVEKGMPVLYMLQRISFHHCILVDCVVTSQNKKYEKEMLNLFKSDAVIMEPRLKPPGLFSRAQIKFGITRNLPKRLSDINDDIFESGYTEWRAIPWPGLIIAHRKFWWYRNSGKVYGVLFVLIVAGFLVLGWDDIFTNK